MALRTRNAALLAKIESSEGVAETPSGSADAILVEAPVFRHEINLVQTDEVTGSLDPFSDIPAGIRGMLEFRLYLKGSGTPETAPDWGVLLKACGFAETVTGTAVPASAEACGAGGSTTTAQLGSSAGTTAQQYRGMPVTLSGEVAGSSFISNYTTGKVATLTDTFAAIDADTSYQIPKNVLYKPSSSAASSLTMELYRDGLKFVLLGARGSFSLELAAGGVAVATFRFMGMVGTHTDTSVPSTTYDATRPPVIRGGNSAVAKLARTAFSARAITFDLGNTMEFPPNANATQGFDPPLITRRKMTGQLDPNMTLLATRDLFAGLQAATEYILHTRFGGTAGNRLGFTFPSIQLTQHNPGDRNGIATEEIAFNAVASANQDAGLFICQY